MLPNWIRYWRGVLIRNSFIDILSGDTPNLSEHGIFMFRKYTWSLVWTLLILILSLLPKRSFPDVHFSIPYLDKFVHFTLYFILLTLFTWEAEKAKTNALIFNGLIGSVVLSFGTELGQKYFFAGRSFEILDIVANIIGSIVGVFFFRIFLKMFL